MQWFFFALISSIFSSAAAISQKKILHQMEALAFSFYLSLFNIFFCLPFVWNIDFSKLSWTILLVLLVKSILNANAFLFVMLSLKNLEISIALPLMVLTPGFVALSAWILLGEALSIHSILGMLLLISGAYALEWEQEKKIRTEFFSFLRSSKHHYVFIALLLFSITSLLDKLLLGKYRVQPYAFLFFQEIFFLLFFLAVFCFFAKKQAVTTIPWKWIVLVAIFTLIYRYTQIEAVKIAPVALVLSIKRTSVFFSAILGGKIFHEHALCRKAIAILGMLFGVILILGENANF